MVIEISSSITSYMHFYIQNICFFKEDFIFKQKSILPQIEIGFEVGF